MKFGKQPAPVADIDEDNLEVHKPKAEAAGVKAVMVATPGHDIDTESVRAWCAAELAYYKVPEHWEVRAEPLPRNAAGKILKDKVRDANANTGFIEE